MGEFCRDRGVYFFFISTDYIFDGSKEIYREEDIPNPLNIYGNLKLQAEKWIRDHLDKFVIIRTTNVFGWDPQTVTPNFMMNLYHSVSQRKKFYAPSFLFGHPTYVTDLASAMIELYQKKTTGVFHVVGDDYVNRYNWSLEACDKFNLDSSFIEKMEYPRLPMVPRPMRMRLSCDKFKQSYQTELRGMSDGVSLMAKELKKHD